MKKKRFWIVSMVVILLLIIVALMGKPPSMGGPPKGDFPVQAVVGLVTEEKVEEALELVASLAAAEKISLLAELDGRVMEVAFSEGGKVSKGDVLFRLDEVTSKARLEEAEAGFNMAKLSFDRNKELLTKEVISQEEFDQAEAQFLDRSAALALARDEYGKTVVKAPFTGVAGEQNVDAGQFVNRGQMLTELVAMNPVESVIEMPERYLAKVALGQKVTFNTDVYPGETFVGKVTFIAPTINELSRTVRVKAEIANDQIRLRPGQYGRIRVVFSTSEKALVIPESCVMQQGAQTMVVYVNAEGKAEFRPVELGQRMDAKVEVRSGLAAGDQVVVEGLQKIWAPGKTIHAAPESSQYGVEPFTPPGAAPQKASEDTSEPKA